MVEITSEELTCAGEKIVQHLANVENTGGAAADVDYTFTFGEVEQVKAVLSLYITTTDAQGVIPKQINGNKVTVTVLNLAAGASTTVYLTVIGY